MSFSPAAGGGSSDLIGYAFSLAGGAPGAPSGQVDTTILSAALIALGYNPSAVSPAVAAATNPDGSLTLSILRANLTASLSSSPVAGIGTGVLSIIASVLPVPGLSEISAEEVSAEAIEAARGGGGRAGGSAAPAGSRGAPGRGAFGRPFGIRELVEQLAGDSGGGYGGDSGGGGFGFGGDSGGGGLALSEAEPFVQEVTGGGGAPFTRRLPITTFA